MQEDRREQFRRDLLVWAEDELREFPWREPDRSVYEAFIAEFFLTQTPAENVASVYPQFLSDYPSLEALEAADYDELERAIEPLGFQRMRAEALSEIATRVDAIPADETELRSLPRVGPYVANATLCVALERPRPILDRNVIRVYDRAFGDEFPETERERRTFAEQLLPEDGVDARTYNLALIDFGALVCTKRAPRCAECFASEYCSYYQSTNDTAADG